MQEEIVSKSVDIAVRITALTAKEILNALEKIVATMEKKQAERSPTAQKSPQASKQPELKKGKQTLRELHKSGEGLSTIPLTDPNLRLLNREMKKADIDFSCVKDGKGKYTLFFKGKDADEMTRAFKQFTQKSLQRANSNPPIQKVLAAAKAAAQKLANQLGKVKNKDRGAR